MGLDLTWNSFVPQRSRTIFEGFKFSRNAHPSICLGLLNEWIVPHCTNNGILLSKTVFFAGDPWNQQRGKALGFCFLLSSYDSYI